MHTGPDRRISSDDLGEKGESKFRELCADSGLICNPSTRDRAGWDFIVQFRFDTISEKSTLDKRPVPLSCYFQIKTIFSTKNKIRLRLSTAERFAKELVPSLIYVLRVNSDLTFLDSYLIHIANNNLSVILKRLRKEHAKGTTNISNLTIEYDINKSGTPIDITGESLKKVVQECCGQDMEKYVLNKTRDLKNLGFENISYQGSMSLKTKGYKELVDVFLGKKKTKVLNMKMYESRFGIKIEDLNISSKNQIIHIKPNSVGQSSISIRQNRTSPPLVFHGDTFIPAIPNLPPQFRKTIIKFQYIELEFVQNSVKFLLIDEFVNTENKNAQEWIQFFKLKSILSSGSFEFTIILPKISGKPDNRQITFNIPKKREQKIFDDTIYCLSVFQATDKILNMVGLNDLKFSFSSIAKSQDKILALYEILTNEKHSGTLSFSTEIPNYFEATQHRDILFFSFIIIETEIIAFYLIANMIAEKENENLLWSSQSMRLGEILRLSDFERDYNYFMDSAKSDNSIDIVVFNELPKSEF
jgi:hypothetical protein